MLFAIIWAVFIGIAFLVAIIRDEAYKKKREKELQIFKNNIVTVPKHPEIEFIGGENYYHRFHVIWREPAEKYQLILWLRYDIDGLLLNDDGSFEWIRKNKEEVQYEYYTEYVQDILGNSCPIQRRRPVSVSYQPQQSVTRQIDNEIIIDDGIRTLNVQIQSEMDRLRYELLIQQMQVAQIQQTQNIINSLQSSQLWTVSPEYMMNRRGN